MDLVKTLLELLNSSEGTIKVSKGVVTVNFVVPGKVRPTSLTLDGSIQDLMELSNKFKPNVT